MSIEAKHLCRHVAIWTGSILIGLGTRSLEIAAGVYLISMALLSAIYHPGKGRL